MESDKIRKVMDESVAQMTASLGDGERRLHDCERKVKRMSDAAERIKILDNDVT